MQALGRPRSGRGSETGARGGLIVFLDEMRRRRSFTGAGAPGRDVAHADLVPPDRLEASLDDRLRLPPGGTKVRLCCHLEARSYDTDTQSGCWSSSMASTPASRSSC